ncbi:Cytoplasmic tRNA 2-thiolation 2 [Chlorella sorokiniana]|uniref:Cytoplasmic tRNA 2-thiolation protein 2 n=1 Tax=Chlorella sorokiniana TaxID=3076 RepID=A0A2P6U145_CHLSO|nr:Cytoplasmic tRNA 2-thiolation 2 [Chlorella sorokiniana]|eukprot:PRW60032.1 Cytoplasmic tRNA 2-thiolation 2 [Chlorella sorokiniana]
MPAPAGSPEPAQQQQDEQQATDCNGSSTELECGDQGCGGGSDPLPAAAAVPPPGTVCIKCRKAEAEVIARGREPLCHPCLHEQLLSKVRNAVRVHSLILPGDRLALAYSGGPASAALLHFLAQLRNPRTDRPARGKVSFTLHIIHIDESAALGQSPEQQAASTASVAAAAAQYCEGSEGGVTYHCLPLETVFDEGSAAATADGSSTAAGSGSSSLFSAAPRPEQRQRLQSLLASVSDPTGRQDLSRHLRTRLLLRAAAELGCARLARGDCATALAAHIVAAASKGCGYSLAGDVRLVDARHGSRLPPVFLPLREVSARELGVVCARWRLPLADPSALGRAVGPAAAVDKKNINALAAAFVAGMEAHNPGSVPNILNTISKLEAFPWNDPPAPAGSQPAGRAGQQQQHANGSQQEDEQQERQQMAAVLCPVCWAPLADDELPGGSSGSAGADASSGHTSGGSGTVVAAAAAGCCLSCFQQIMGGVAGSAGPSSSVAAALPEDVQQQMAGLAAAGPRAAMAGGPCGTEQLRQQIAEFLLE